MYARAFASIPASLSLTLTQCTPASRDMTCPWPSEAALLRPASSYGALPGTDVSVPVREAFGQLQPNILCRVPEMRELFAELWRNDVLQMLAIYLIVCGTGLYMYCILCDEHEK